MNAADILLLGLKYSVSAISKPDGLVLWKTEVSKTFNGDDFATVVSDGEKVFAHTEGKLHCLDLANGRLGMQANTFLLNGIQEVTSSSLVGSTMRSAHATCA